MGNDVARQDGGRNTGMDATHRRDSAENFDGRNELPANGRQSVQSGTNNLID